MEYSRVCLKFACWSFWAKKKRKVRQNASNCVLDTWLVLKSEYCWILEYLVPVRYITLHCKSIFRKRDLIRNLEIFRTKNLRTLYSIFSVEFRGNVRSTATETYGNYYKTEFYRNTESKKKWSAFAQHT